MVNPKTEYVRGFDFSWEGTTLHVTYRVKGRDMDEIALSLTVNTA